MQWITNLAQVNQSKACHVIVLIILVFLEVKCDLNMVGYHYIYDILGANYGMLSLIIIPPSFQSIYMPVTCLLHTNMCQPC